jgi:hypothetical protein
VHAKLHVMATLPPGKGPPVPIALGGWVGTEAGLDVVTKKDLLPLLRIRYQLSSLVSHYTNQLKFHQHLKGEKPDVGVSVV